ncbi:MAG TPA: site-specific DNA-methyltransferase [Nitrospiraceae bacterium]|nr:site-specific DNA-methyltransferase [Nitrospiraceae bacterium]
MPKKLEAESALIWNADSVAMLEKMPEKELFDLVITSPPYNIGKPYEKKSSLNEYVEWHTDVISKIVHRTKTTGSICWQVGNYVDNGSIAPLDYVFHPIFERLGLQLRNRIIWHYGHGQHHKRRFSGRYEVVLWYTKSDEYKFDLDAVRVPPKYPGKRAYRGPRAGQISSHPLGKNPEDVWVVADSEYDLWNIPNVKASHVEKTKHPCQFPVGLVERLILALTEKHDLVFDPFAGTASTGVAALTHNRRFWGCEIDQDYALLAQRRLERALHGEERFRSHARPLYDHRTSKLSRVPNAREYGVLSNRFGAK